MSSIAYAEQVQALNNNPTWADQVEISEPQGPALSYATPKVGENDNANEAIATESMPEPRNTDANNNSTCQPQKDLRHLWFHIQSINPRTLNCGTEVFALFLSLG